MKKLQRFLLREFLLKGFFIMAALATLGSASAMASAVYSTTVSLNPAPFSETFTLPNFDMSLGTLAGITITFSYAVTGDVAIFDDLSVNEPFTDASVSIPITLATADGLSADQTGTTSLISGTAVAGTVTSFAVGSAGGILSILVPLADFSDYEVPHQFAGSSDTYTLTAGNVIYAGSGPGGLFFGGDASLNGTATVTYTLTSDTPEPSTIVLIGPWLLGLARLTRGKRHRPAL